MIDEPKQVVGEVDVVDFVVHGNVTKMTRECLLEVRPVVIKRSGNIAHIYKVPDMDDYYGISLGREDGGVSESFILHKSVVDALLDGFEAVIQRVALGAKGYTSHKVALP
jgi:hypothetical protein